MDTAEKANEKSKEDQPWLKVSKVAEELQIPLTRCYELIQSGALPAVRVGERSIRVHRRELEEYLFEHCRAAAPTK